MTTSTTLSADLALRDLTDPRLGPHAVQQMITEILEAVVARCRGDLRLERGERIVQVADNYDRLGYGAAARARDARYTRYVDETRMLRSQTSALIPPVLRRLAGEHCYDVTIACSGMVYRRDAIDRLHTGTPHQLDLWHLTTTTHEDSRGERLAMTAHEERHADLPVNTAREERPGERPATTAHEERRGEWPATTAHEDRRGERPATTAHEERRGEWPATTANDERRAGLPGATACGEGGDELLGLVGTVLGAALPGVRWRANPAEHPYTEDGREIEAYVAGRWVEVGECGRAARRVLAGAGLPPYVRGLALGLGLDRLVMLRKGVPDIRLLRSADPRVARQMLDLAPWRPVSAHPAARRDVSVAMRAGVTAEEVGDLVRESLGADARLVEEIAVRGVTEPADLPEAARERLGIGDGEVNVLLRVVLRDLDGSIPGEVANDLRDRIYAALHHA